jgi:hypothetical protein
VHACRHPLPQHRGATLKPGRRQRFMEGERVDGRAVQTVRHTMKKTGWGVGMGCFLTRVSRSNIAVPRREGGGGDTPSILLFRRNRAGFPGTTPCGTLARECMHQAASPRRRS